MKIEKNINKNKKFNGNKNFDHFLMVAGAIAVTFMSIAIFIVMFSYMIANADSIKAAIQNKYAIKDTEGNITGYEGGMICWFFNVFWGWNNTPIVLTGLFGLILTIGALIGLIIYVSLYITSLFGVTISLFNKSRMSLTNSIKDVAVETGNIIKSEIQLPKPKSKTKKSKKQKQTVEEPIVKDDLDEEENEINQRLKELKENENYAISDDLDAKVEEIKKDSLESKSSSELDELLKQR